jgi:uncharacterized membrane protein YgdD (TMEM256/DUF423 family)
MNQKIILKVAAFFGATAVAFGALGAHALKSVLSAQSLASFTTAVRYQMWHALALLFLVAFAEKINPSPWISRLWTSGVVLFSGSIYLLSLDELMNLNFSFLGPLTPIGGLALILGWILLLIRSGNKGS